MEYIMESIALSLERIANSLEENNRLMAKGLQTENANKLITQNASVVNAAKDALQDPFSLV